MAFMGSSKGYTLFELMLALALVGILAVSVPLLLSQNTPGINDMDQAVHTSREMLLRSQEYARAVKGDSSWGVAFLPGKIALFKGTSYATRDPAYDETEAVYV